eukprot:1141549-Pelagomonas_calceolata.AAC.14
MAQGGKVRAHGVEVANQFLSHVKKVACASMHRTASQEMVAARASRGRAAECSEQLILAQPSRIRAARASRGRAAACSEQLILAQPARIRVSLCVSSGCEGFTWQGRSVFRTAYFGTTSTQKSELLCVLRLQGPNLAGAQLLQCQQLLVAQPDYKGESLVKALTDGHCVAACPAAIAPVSAARLLRRSQ